MPAPRSCILPAVADVVKAVTAAAAMAKAHAVRAVAAAAVNDIYPHILKRRETVSKSHFLRTAGMLRGASLL